MIVPQGFLGWRAALGGAACLAASLVASVQSPCAGEPIWDVIAAYLRDIKTVSAKAPNIPTIKGAANNPGMAD